MRRSSLSSNYASAPLRFRLLMMFGWTIENA